MAVFFEVKICLLKDPEFLLGPCEAWSAFGRERESGGDSEDLRKHVAQLVKHFL